ncbi:MAG: N,N-dimethylformamidase beta subunit family domain-containing protein, partial [Candidatus Rokuibacteriota bacterium]
VLLSAAPPDSPVTQENRQPGAVEWQLKHYSFDRGSGSGLRSPRLEGYCSDTSVYPGEKIDFRVSTNPARRFTLDIYRTGYYGGLKPS